MRNLEKFWCNDHLEEVAGDCGRYFPGGKEACLEQAERIDVYKRQGYSVRRYIR